MASARPMQPPGLEIEALQVHSVIISSEVALGNIVTRANDLLSEHRDWLKAHNQQQTSTQTLPPLTTPPTSLLRRSPQNPPLPECSSISVAASLAGAAAASASISSLQAALNGANSAANSLGLSLGSVVQSLSRAQISASSFSSSVSSAISSAQSSANSGISSAISSAASSASSAIASAQAVASEAQAIASVVSQQALANVTAANAAAQESRTAAMNTTKLVLAITFAVIGSSLLSILLYYLVSRYRQRRANSRAGSIRHSMIRRVPDGDVTPSLSPPSAILPRGRPPRDRNTFRGMSQVRSSGGNSSDNNVEYSMFPLPPGTNALDFKQKLEGKGPSESPVLPREIPLSRKTTLIYDPDRPDQPPTFSSEYEESTRVQSPRSSQFFVNRLRQSIQRTARASRSGRGANEQPKMNTTRNARSSLSDIGTAF